MDVRDVLPHDLRQWHRRHSVGHRGVLRECPQLVCQHLLAEPPPFSSALQPTRFHVARCNSDLHRGWPCRQCLSLLRCPHHVHVRTPDLAPCRLLSPFVVPSLPPTLAPWRRSMPPWSCCWWGAPSSWEPGARTTATTDSRVRTLRFRLTLPSLPHCGPSSSRCVQWTLLHGSGVQGRGGCCEALGPVLASVRCLPHLFPLYIGFIP